MDDPCFDDVLERLATYQYLEDLVAGQRVLEIGCGSGLGALQLLALGAARVVALDADVRAAQKLLGERPEATVRRWRPPRLDLDDRAFDLVLLADAGLAASEPALLDEIVRVTSPTGRVVLRTASGDHPALARGLSYGELLDLLEPHFERVRVVGQCPFVGYSLVELSEESDREPDVMLDGALMGGGVEEVVAYVALCEPAGVEAEQRPYGILQVPAAGSPGLEAWRGWAEDPEQVAAARASSAAAAAADEERSLEADGSGRASGATTQAPSTRAVSIKSYTDRAGGRLARWRWPAFSKGK